MSLRTSCQMLEVSSFCYWKRAKPSSIEIPALIFQVKNKAIPHQFERLFLISWENNRDCNMTMPLSLKTIEVQIKGDQGNMRFRTVQVYWKTSRHFPGRILSRQDAKKTSKLNHVSSSNLKLSSKNSAIPTS